MANTILQGKVSFVNHEKKTVVIEYEANGKKKAISGTVNDETQMQLKNRGVIKKTHDFQISLQACRAGETKWLLQISATCTIPPWTSF
jgi:hypothetical protein